MNSQVSAGEPADGRRRPEHWLVRFGTVPRLAEYFSPRPETGFDISIRPAPGETAVLVPRTQAGGAGEHPLTGMGGTGKTQLAAALARFLWAAGAVDLLAWVHAASRDSLITGYAQAGAAAGAPRARPAPGAPPAPLLAPPGPPPPPPPAAPGRAPRTPPPHARWTRRAAG